MSEPNQPSPEPDERGRDLLGFLINVASIAALGFISATRQIAGRYALTLARCRRTFTGA